MRDHLLGFAPIAALTAEQEEAQQQGWDIFDDYENEYPFGIPERIHAENRLRWEGAPTRQAQLRAEAFEQVVAPNPDGTRTPKRDPARITNDSLMDAMGRAMRKHTEALAENVVRNNALFLNAAPLEMRTMRGISVKPPPVVEAAPPRYFQGTAIEFDKPKEAERIADVFMAGYKVARQDETEALNMSAPMRADLWAKQRAEQLKANDEERAKASAHFRDQVEHIKAAGGLEALVAKHHAAYRGYEILAVHPDDVLHPSEYEFRQASCGFKITSL